MMNMRKVLICLLSAQGALSVTVTSTLKLFSDDICPSSCITSIEACSKALALATYPDCHAKSVWVFNSTESNPSICQGDKEVYYSSDKGDGEPDFVGIFRSAVSLELKALAAIDYKTAGFTSGKMIIHLATPVVKECDLVSFELKSRGESATQSSMGMPCGLPNVDVGFVRGSALLIAGQKDIEMSLNGDDAVQYFALTESSATCANFVGASLEYDNLTIEVELNPLYDPYIVLDPTPISAATGLWKISVILASSLILMV